MKRFLFFAAILFSVCSISAIAADAVVHGDDYTLSLSYNDTANPGDAVFVRMKLTQNTAALKKPKVTKEQFAATTAVLTLSSEGKTLRSSDFYVLPAASDKSRGIITYLTGIPLSSWWTHALPCTLTVTYKLHGETSMQVDLPFALIDKEFVSETLQLNQSNTDIKTDTSPKRMAQIDKLNKVLEAVHPQAVYQTTPFTPPTPATRRTSFFADRRVYAYTNGKSSTSLHYGTDYGVPEGSEVKTCARGKVVMAEDRVSTGLSVVIEHLPGLYSLYYHMSELKVAEGDTVKEGTLIGLSGSTGLATGPHLHWEMRLNREAVNPDFFTGDFTFSKGSN
ncbi:MAG: M23 family metallopeptidase [Treponema sp.]|nr:M23 family metallopeptidase [Treponema sp.]